MAKLFSRSHPFLKYLVLLFVSLLVFSNTLQHDFVWDDQLVITQNDITKKGVSGLKEIWTTRSYIKERLIYRPIPQSIHAIAWELSPSNAKIHHAINILFFALTCLVLFHFLRIYFDKANDWLLFFISLLFALHPVHTEVVANAKSLDELLSLFFALLALISLKKLNVSHVLLAVFLFACALLSKLSAIGVIPLIAIPIVGQYSERITNYIKKIGVDIHAIDILLMILLASYYLLSFNTASSKINVLPLFIASPLVLLMSRKNIKIFSLLLLVFLFTIEGYWPYTFVLYLIHFSTKELNTKNAKIILALECLAILAITLYWGDNTWGNKLFLAIGLFMVLSYEHSSSFIKRSMWCALGIIMILPGIGDVTISVNFLFGTFATGFAIYFKNKNFKYLLLLLVLYSPIFLTSEIELTTRPEAQAEIVRAQPLMSVVQTPILPFHNILILANSIEKKSATICRIQLGYLKQLVLPTALVHQYGTWQIKMASWKNWDVYLSILIHLILLGMVYYFFKQKVYLIAWGILWYFSSIALFTNIVRLLPDTMAERFLLIPSIGFSIALVSGLYFLIQKFQRNEQKSLLTLGLILMPLFAYYGYKTIDRNKDWKNNYTLAANTLPFAPNNATINAQYAVELNNLIKSGQIQNIDSAEALVVKHYNKAIDIFPDFYGPQSDLANYYILKSQPDLAFPYLKEAARLKPEEWKHHYFLGLIYYEKNKYTNSVEHFDALISDSVLQMNPYKFPELLDAYEFKGRCLHNIGRDLEAYETLNDGINIYHERSTYVLLASLYRKTGRTPLALETFERLLLILPEDQEVINTMYLLQQGKIL